jgi:hypothetical protein
VTSAARAEPQARPPEWITRVFPQATQRPDPVTERVINSRAFTLYFGLLGLAIAFLILGTIAGTVGWIGVQLLVFALRGRRAAKDLTTVSYRPVGQGELDLIAAADYRVFPPRLPHQPMRRSTCRSEEFRR